MIRKIRIGALISGGGTNLQAIIDSCESGKINGEMVFVGADTPDARGLERAKNHHIPCFVVDYRSILQGFGKTPEYSTLPDDFNLDEQLCKQSLFLPDQTTEKLKRFLTIRAIAEAKLLHHMDRYPFDLLVLAGFMRNLSPYFIDRVNTAPQHPRIMNIHPALLPSFPGVDGYGDTFRYGCKIGGCTVHFIDYGEDSGPIIGQSAFSITPEDTIDTIKQKGLSLEWELYPACIQLVAEDRLRVRKKTYCLENGKKFCRTVVEILKESPA